MKAALTLFAVLISTVALAWGGGPGGGGPGGGGGGQQPGGGGNQPDQPGGGGAFTYDTFLTDSTSSGGCIVYGDLMTGYVAGETTITIPAAVTQIADGAVSGNASVTALDVTAAPAITVIPESFASGCDGLLTITLPETVTTIGASAFTMDSSLTNFVGEGVATVGDYAFFGCTSLVLPGSTTYETTGEAALTGVSYATTNGEVYASEVAPLVAWIQADGQVASSRSSTLSGYDTAALKMWLTNDVTNLEAYLYADEIVTNKDFSPLSVSGTNFLFTAQDLATLAVAHASLQVSTDLVNWKTVAESDIVDGVYAMPSPTNGFARILYSLTW